MRICSLKNCRSHGEPQLDDQFRTMISGRVTKTCETCRKLGSIYQDTWRTINPEEDNRRQAEWRKNNPEKVSAIGKIWRDALTPKQRKEYLSKMRERANRYRDSLTPEQRKEMAKKKREYRKKRRDRARKL